MTDHNHTPSVEGTAADQKPKKWHQREKVQPFLFVAGVLIYLLIGLILWSGLDWYINPHSSGQKKDLIQALGLIMAGLAGAGGIYFTWRNLAMTKRNMEDTQETTQRQLDAAQAQLRIAQEGQVTERFTKAIDQLGEEDDNDEPRLEIRIGGIYALERIAKHYQEPSLEDYGPVMEILTAYIRENAKWTPVLDRGYRALSGTAQRFYAGSCIRTSENSSSRHLSE
jgi:hypothetical protein